MLDPGPLLLTIAALVLLPRALKLAALSESASIPLTIPALLLGASFFVPVGMLAASLTLPWLAVTAALAWNSRRHPLTHVVPLAYLVIGAAWAFAARAGIQPLGFEPAIVQLTALHFHYAGALLPLLLIPSARELPGLLPRLALHAAILGVPLVAAGITATKLNFGATVELAAAIFMTLAGCLAAAVYFRLAARFAPVNRTAALLFIAASVSLAFGMGFALLYGTRWLLAKPVIDIPMMRLTHGVLNSLGFTGCALLAWGAASRSTTAGSSPQSSPAPEPARR